MKYVFNPNNNQINPVTEMTHADPALSSKVVSSELYALVCQGKVAIGDVAAMFAVGKSPEILVKNHAAVKASPMSTAPANTKTLDVPPVGKSEGDMGDSGNVSAATAFDGRELTKKTQAELLIVATAVGVDVNAEGFAPTRPNLIKAIMAKAEKAAAPSEPVTVTSVTSGGEPVPPME